MKWIYLLAFCIVSETAYNQSSGFVPTVIDVLQYNFDLTLSDKNDQLTGFAEILVKQRVIAEEIKLDLANKNDSGKGMTVSAVWCNGIKADFTHENNKLSILVGQLRKNDSTLQIKVSYAGIPADGLIIARNKYGHRTFFGDNWPNRAHQWLPCNDHPSDKAPVKFRVTAPDHYQVVSNGIQLERTNNPSGTTTTIWTETTAIPTKVMVIGLADFAVGFAGMVNCIPVYSWLYPEDKEKGFYDYSVAIDILPFFIRQVGPYPFVKLANVQSKTIFGGMENAGCIFYYENSVNGIRKEEDLFAHEIAHQWFGNSATEISWQHLWLSEGFATCMTNLYLENKYGRDTLNSLLSKQRKEVIEFSLSSPERPVIDSLETHFMNLLNANSYQKAGWFLHMLRRKIGDENFWKVIRKYYARYARSNASTSDFTRVCEEVSAQSLEEFFNQWLRQPGQPKLDIKYSTKKKGLVNITIKQLQEHKFEFPLELDIVTASGIIHQRLSITEKKQSFTIPSDLPVNTIIADPNTNLLAEWTINRVK